MARIGMPTHFPDIKAKKCCQCGEWFYYKRLTKIYCSDACRQQAKRGVPPDDKNPNALGGYEQFAALIATEKPYAFENLQKLRDKYGFRAVEMCLDVIWALIN